MKYPRILLFMLVLISPAVSFSQADVADIHKEIDRQLWKAFAKTYNNFDAEGFNALHTEDVIRSGPRMIWVGEEYKARNRESFKLVKERGEKRTITFTLESRQTKDNLSYEVGYYKVTMQPKEGELRHYYGRFHCVLKKIDGQWKIAQDWDAGVIMGKEVTEEVYQTGTPVKL